MTGFASLDRLIDGPLRLLSRAKRILIRAFLLFSSVWLVTTAIPLYRPVSWWLPHIGANWFSYSLATHLLRDSEWYMLPHGETIIALGPWDTFVVICEIGAVIALAAVIPYLTLLALRHGWRGLKGTTRWAIIWLAPLALGLFVAGMVTALLVLPWLYGFAYQIQGPAGVSGTVSLTSFVTETLFFVIAMGLSFEIPVVTYGLGYAGVLTAPTMRRAMWPAFFGCAGLALIISPGVGGGVLEIPMALGFFGLYIIGYLMVKRAEAARSGAERRTEIRQEA